MIRQRPTRRARLIDPVEGGGGRTAFTVLELLVALAVAAGVTAGIYALYSRYAEAGSGEDPVLATQQAARRALDTLTQDLLRAGRRAPGSGPAIVYAAADELWLEVAGEPAGRRAGGRPAPALERIRYVLDGVRLQREVYRQVDGLWPATPVAELSEVLAEPVVPRGLDAAGAPGAAGASDGEAGAPALRFAYYTGSAGPGSGGRRVPLDVGRPRRADDPADRPALAAIREVEVTLTLRSSRPDPATNRHVYRTLRTAVAPDGAGPALGIGDRS